MNVARGFLVIGPLYLFVGILIGAYMGASGNMALAPAHAHINLLGFTLMMIFGLFYAVFPVASTSRLATAHFWLHQIGALVLLTMLVLLFTNQITEAAMTPVAPLAEVIILVGVLCFFLNVVRYAR